MSCVLGVLTLTAVGESAAVGGCWHKAPTAKTGALLRGAKLSDGAPAQNPLHEGGSTYVAHVAGRAAVVILLLVHDI